MVELGEIYREFRKGKSVTLADAAHGIVSVPFLSKFERGMSDISYTHLIELLERINVQITEFDYVYQTRNHGNMDFIPNFQLAYQSGNVATLRSLLRQWQRKDGDFVKLQVIQLKMMLATLTEEELSRKEINFLQRYFERLKNWTFFELYLFGHAMPFLDTFQMIDLFQDLNEKGLMHSNFRQDSFSIVFYLYNNLILNLIRRNEPYQALKFVTLLETQQINNRDYYHKTRFFSLKGLALYLTNNQQSGLTLLQKSINITLMVQDDSGFLLHEKAFLSQFLTPNALAFVFENFTD